MIEKNLPPAFILYVLAFPHLPVILQGSYTQPTFIFAFFILLFIRPNILFPSNNPLYYVFVYLIITGLLYWLFSEILYISYYPNKYIAVIQFAMGMYIGSIYSWRFHSRTYIHIILIYVLASLVGLSTGNMIEQYLFSASSEGQILSGGGRGAWALAPEPAFAVSILSSIAALLITSSGVKNNKLIYLLISMVCILTFSVTGFIFAIALILLLILNVDIRSRFFVSLLLGVTVLGAVAIIQKTSFELNIRFLTVLFAVMEGGSISLLDDQSIFNRVHYFIDTIILCMEKPLFGHGFEAESLGGMVYLAYVYGAMGLVVPIICFIYCLLNRSFSERIYLTVWFGYHYMTGFSTLPVIGVVLGSCLNRKEIYSDRCNYSKL